MVLGLFSKQSHTPYLALQAPAQKMIRKKRLPPVDKLQSEISIAAARVLSWSVATNKRKGTPAYLPPKPDMASLLAELNHEIAKVQPIKKGQKLSLDQLAERATIYRLVETPAAEAEAVIALFKDTAAARVLWQRGEDFRHRIADYGENLKAFREATQLWEMQGDIPRYHEDEDLIGFLRDMRPHDPDLWHTIACQNDPGLKVDQDALFWIFDQPSCDRATVAAFIQQHASLGYLSALVKSDHKREHTAFADRIAVIITRWNDGFYTASDLELSEPSPDAIKDSFMEQRDKVHALLGKPVWDVPHDLFTSFSGRPARPTFHFRHGDGLMTLPPDPKDYFS